MSRRSLPSSGITELFVCSIDLSHSIVESLSLLRGCIWVHVRVCQPSQPLPCCVDFFLGRIRIDAEHIECIHKRNARTNNFLIVVTRSRYTVLSVRSRIDNLSRTCCREVKSPHGSTHFENSLVFINFHSNWNWPTWNPAALER